MPRDVKPQAGQQAAFDMHERIDVSIRGLAIFLAGLVVTVVVIHIAMWGMLKALEHRAAFPGSAGILPAKGGAAAPPYHGPMLQVAPTREMEEFRAREEQALNSYGWVNRTSGIVRIPIERAMELLLQRGLGTNLNAKSPLQLQHERVQRSQPGNPTQ